MDDGKDREKQIVGAAVPKPHQFQPGNRLGGRPPGARNRLTEVALQALGEHFNLYGAAAIHRVFTEEPGTYLRIVASLLPRSLTVEKISPFEHLSDEELTIIEEALRAGRARVVSEVDGEAVEPKPEKP